MSGSLQAERRSRLGWIVLLGALSLEAFGGLALLVPTTLGMLDASDEPLGSRLSIFLALLIAWLWVCATLLAGMRSRPSWVRGSALTIHVLLFAAGTGVLQLQLASQLLGWALVLFALVGFFAAVLARPTIPEEPATVPEAPGADESSAP